MNENFKNSMVLPLQSHPFINVLSVLSSIFACFLLIFWSSVLIFAINYPKICRILEGFFSAVEKKSGLHTRSMTHLDRLPPEPTILFIPAWCIISGGIISAMLAAIPAHIERVTLPRLRLSGRMFEALARSSGRWRSPNSRGTIRISSVSLKLPQPIWSLNN